jgi:hypothetical protein
MEKPMNGVDAWRMVQRRAADLGVRHQGRLSHISGDGHHGLSRGRRDARERASNGRARKPATTKLYDHTGDEITLDEVERITI